MNKLSLATFKSLGMLNNAHDVCQSRHLNIKEHETDLNARLSQLQALE